MIDNEITKNIKKAFRLNIPKEYLADEHGSFIDISERIRGMVDENRDINDIVDYCVRMGLELEDGLMIIMNYKPELITVTSANKVYVANRMNIIYSEDTLSEIYDKWILKRDRLLDDNIIDYHLVTNIQRNLTKYEAVEADIEIMKARKKYDVVPNTNITKLNDSPEWNYKDLHSIIDHIIMSHDVPLVVGMTKNNEKIIKIFSQTSKEVYNTFKIFLKTPFEPNTITLFVADIDANYLNKNSYLDNILMLDSSSIIIKSSPMKLERAMPFFRYINGEDVYINAVVKYVANVNKELFNYMTDNDPLVSSYISLIERTNFRTNRVPYAEFANITERLKSKATIKINTYGSQFGSIFEMQIYGAASTSEINMISTIVGHLLGYYDEIRNYYYNEHIKSDPNIEDTEDMEVGYNVPRSKYKTLKDLFPEVFTHPVTGYGKSCQCRKLQPIIINKDEIDSWQKFGFVVARYPPPIEPYNKAKNIIPDDAGSDEPLFWYVCPSNFYKHPSLKPWNNTDEETNLVPCCASKDIYEKYLMTGGGRIANYFESNIEKPKNKIHKTSNVLAAGNFGLLSDKFNSWLKLGFEDGNDDNNYYRWGINTTENSFLACIHTALNIKESVNLTINAMKDLPAATYAQEIGKDTELENDDYNNPFICYRGIEEVFNVSVHIISGSGIITPNNQICHIRRQENNRCILIWYHEDENICELIVYGKVRLISMQKKLRRVFDVEMNNFIGTAYPVPYEIYNGVLYKNPFTSIDFGNLKIQSQWIDPYGKCRAISCLLNFTHITLMFLPTQPFAVSSANYETHKVDLNTARSLFSYRETSKIESLGVWFAASDIEEAIFIPVNDTYKSNARTAYTFPPYPGALSAPDKKMRNIIDENNSMEYVLEISWWIFLLYLTQTGNKTISVKLANRFVSEYIEKTDKDVTLNKIHKLPSDLTFQEACKLIFDQNKIISKYGDILGYHIIAKASSEEGLIPIKIEFINKKYKYEVDYDGMNNTAITFLSETNLNTWINSSDDNMSYFTNSLQENTVFKDSGNNVYAAVPLDDLPDDKTLWSILDNEMILARRGKDTNQDYIYAEHKGKYGIMIPLN